MSINEHYIILEGGNGEKQQKKDAKYLKSLFSNMGNFNNDTQENARNIYLKRKKEEWLKDNKGTGKKWEGSSENQRASGDFNLEWSKEWAKQQKKEVTKVACRSAIITWFVTTLTTLGVTKHKKNKLIRKLKKSNNIDKKLTTKVRRILPPDSSIRIIVKTIPPTSNTSTKLVVIAHQNLIGYTKDNIKNLSDNELIALLLAEHFYQNKIIEKISSRTAGILASSVIIPLEYVFSLRHGERTSVGTIELFINILFSMGGVKLEKEIDKIFKHKMKELKEIGYDKYYLSAMDKVGINFVAAFEKELEKKGHSKKDIEKLNKVILNKPKKEVTSIIKNSKVFAKLKSS